MNRQLPSRPNLDQLKVQAKELFKAFKAGDAEALKRVKENHPKGSELIVDQTSLSTFALSDAQLTLAREYGFSSWPKLKEHIDSTLLETTDPVALAHQAFEADDASMLRKILQRYPQLKALINEPLGAFGSPAITLARSREMIDVLLEAGADINAKSRWWAGGFGLLHSASLELAEYAIERGARIDIHAAARLGKIDQVRQWLARSPELVHAKGGDGQTPLHFAKTIEIAELLLAHGANINARDVDHESTPAQHMLGNRTEVARFLVQRGCQTDLLMAAALGDIDLAQKHLTENPDCIRMRVSNEYFPMVNEKSGGTIYQWTLGWYVSAHQVARNFGHKAVLNFLMERSPSNVKLTTAAWIGDATAVHDLLRSEPDLPAKLHDEEHRQIAHAARNNNLATVRLMLSAGFSVTAQGQHGGTPLHWGAWHGNIEMVKAILKYHPPINSNNNEFRGTPLGWAIHGSLNGWQRQTGNYVATVETLLAAGAELPSSDGGTEEVQAILRKHRGKSV